MNSILKWLKGLKTDSLVRNKMKMQYEFPTIFNASNKAVFKTKYGHVYIMPSLVHIYSYTDNGGNFAVFTDEFLRNASSNTFIRDAQPVCVPNDEDLLFASWIRPYISMAKLKYYYRTINGRVYWWESLLDEPTLMLVETPSSWCFCSQGYLKDMGPKFITSRFELE